eukprot:2687255-Rhodomonas_salina.1
MELQVNDGLSSMSHFWNSGGNIGGVAFQKSAEYDVDRGLGIIMLDDFVEVMIARHKGSCSSAGARVADTRCIMLCLFRVKSCRMKSCGKLFQSLTVHAPSFNALLTERGKRSAEN